MATRSSIFAWEMPRTEEPGGLHTVHGVTKEWESHALVTKQQHFHNHYFITNTLTAFIKQNVNITSPFPGLFA